jgi:hypothetical protein
MMMYDESMSYHIVILLIISRIIKMKNIKVRPALESHNPSEIEKIGIFIGGYIELGMIEV